ncbi:WLM domain-containing protein [Sphaerosporella brunnea]|uniref:WLM domain-containing protein n=1 Tax=Sphaerosporella brunnea TaxID=1250544 RepID=A0A5J5EFC6_9PEZI|nr:WLM domain-containing protein [Sphaerosporella brunnea]
MPTIGSYSIMRDMPHASRALRLLQHVAHLVKPIMRRHGYYIPRLEEFYRQDFLGLTESVVSYRGVKTVTVVKLTLRDHRDPYRFQPIGQIIETFLHELTHQRFGPHDKRFWRQQQIHRDEFAHMYGLPDGWNVQYEDHDGNGRPKYSGRYENWPGWSQVPFLY